MFKKEKLIKLYIALVILLVLGAIVVALVLDPKAGFINKNQNIYGFLGKLNSGESKIIKICVSLDNMKEPIVLLINNDVGIYKYHIKQTINIS